MDLTQLEMFNAVALTGSITQAAQKVHRVPSNLTTRIRQLEADLGVELFIRENQRLRLSPAGHNFLRYSKQILALVGCDRLTIAPPLLKELQASDTPVVRKLIPASQILPRPVPLSEAEFRWEHNQDPMAVEKLAEGIRLFAVDQRKLEDLLAAKLSL